MLDPFFIKKFLNIGVSEFRAIVTSNILDLQLKFILSSSNEFLDNSLYFAFIMHKKYPSKMRKIINNNKTIFVTANAYVGNLVQTNPCVEASTVLLRLRYSWQDVEHQLASWLGMRYTTYLSQKQHWFAQGCAPL